MDVYNGDALIIKVRSLLYTWQFNGEFIYTK